MNELRWILIGFGIVLLAGIYLWGRRGGAAVAEDGVLRSRPEPSLQPREFSDVRREPAHPVPDEMPDYVPQYDEEPLERSAEVMRSDEYEVTAVRPAGSRTETSRGFTSNEVARPNSPPDFRRGRLEPTLDEGITEELSVNSSAPATSAPTLSSSDTPEPRRTERRKILSLRLMAAPQRLEGAKLQEVLQTELLEHGKYGVFHRLHSDGASIFMSPAWSSPAPSTWKKSARRSIRASPYLRSCPVPCRACMLSMS